MNAVGVKTEITSIDGTPVKRMFWSIISDYGLKTGICELVDNAIDFWTQHSRRRALHVSITLDVDRQLISINDDAGGVKESDLRLLVVPGGSRNDPNAELIGIFGVGSKRASIALGEHVEIRTRFKNEKSLELDIPKEWVGSQTWELPAYEIPSIAPNTTQVDISYLRKPFSADDVKDLTAHVGDTYSWFIRNGCTISVNGSTVKPHTFENWAFPPKYLPRRAAFSSDFGSEGKLAVSITAGLIQDRDPERENYGVYFYCNRRLIVKELRTRDVGYFVSSEAGVPHPDASLCRAIVHLQGPAKLMPWNSSKSGINFDHDAFRIIRPTLIQLVSHFSSLSRRLKNNWPGKVYRFRSGKIVNVDHAEAAAGKLILPPLPRIHKLHVEQLKSLNKSRIRDQPWTLGLVEAMAAVEIISRKRLETKNRVALILLDSNFEIALKEFIVHRRDLFPPNQYNNAAIQTLFGKRHRVVNEISLKVSIPQNLLAKAQHFYDLRNKLIHERATVGIADTDIDNYRDTVEKILAILFKLRFSR